MVSFAVQKLLSLIRSHWLLFLLPWETDLRKYCYNLSQSVLPTSFSRSFMVSCLIFRSSKHSEFTFVYGVRECSNFINLHVAVQCFQHCLLKRLVFSPWYILASFVIN